MSPSSSSCLARQMAWDQPVLAFPALNHQELAQPNLPVSQVRGACRRRWVCACEVHGGGGCGLQARAAACELERGRLPHRCALLACLALGKHQATRCRRPRRHGRLHRNSGHRRRRRRRPRPTSPGPTHGAWVLVGGRWGSDDVEGTEGPQQACGEEAEETRRGGAAEVSLKLPKAGSAAPGTVVAVRI